MKKITNNDLSVLDDSKVQLMDFNATWCGPCKAIKPKLEAMEQTFKEVEFADIDADENEDLFEKFGVRNVPTVIVRNGDKTERIVGAINEETVSNAIRKVSE